MLSENPRVHLIEEDFVQALPIAFAILAQCLAQVVPKNRAEELLQDALENSPAAKSLSEQQRLHVWRLCQSALTGSYI